MAENTKVRTPYNFVPFSNKVLEYQEELPSYGDIHPALKTGEIRVTLTAETPVFVSDGDKDNPHFFRSADGRFMLPGSTIRGMVRANMQILGFGLVRPGEDIEDKRVFYRNIANAKNSTGGELKEYYHNVLGVESRKSPSGTSCSVPKKIKAGYLRRVGDSYQIQPIAGGWFKVSKETLGYVGLDKRYAEIIPVYYTAADKYVKKIQLAGGPLPEGMRRGALLCPGVDTGGDGTRGNPPKFPAHRYVFPMADEEAGPVPISQEDALSYAADWESRKNSLAGGTQIRGEKIRYNPSFWKLPEGDEEKPVFYIQYDGHVYFGMTLFPRIGYRFSLKNGLPQSHLEKMEQPEFLDYPRAILGYAEENRSRRSRVSFGDFAAQGDPKELPLVKTVLGNPKISYYPGYVVNGAHYNKEREEEAGKAGFQLRGYKLYWLKEAEAAATDKEKVASKLRPLPAGTVFSGMIRYKNLREEELGLLLWALRLEEGCYHSVGMGKPYGYGRMKLAIDSLREYNFRTLYSPDGLCGQAEELSETAVQRYIDAYDAFAVKALDFKPTKKDKKQGKQTLSLRNCREVKILFYLRSVIRNSEEVRYMELNEYQNVRDPLPDVTEIQKEEKAEKAAQAAAKQAAERKDDDSMAALLAKLKEDINKRKC